MRRLLVIGIGAGDPEHVTAQAVRALNEVDVFFVVSKGDDTEDLVALRRRSRALRRGSVLQDRRSARPAARPHGRRVRRGGGRLARAARASVWGAALRDELGEDGAGGFIVWGDPSLYDSTIDVLERIRRAGARSSSTTR